MNFNKLSANKSLNKLPELPEDYENMYLKIKWNFISADKFSMENIRKLA